MSKGGGGDRVEHRVDYPNWYIEQLRPLLGDLSQVYGRQEAQGGLNRTQRDALNMMGREARQGSPIADAGVKALEGLFNRGGMAQGTGAFARDLMGGEFANPALAETQRIAMGGDVGSNPFLDAAYGRAAGNVTQHFNEALVPDMDRAFAASGRLGSGTYAQLRGRAEDRVGDALGDLATGIYGGAYEGDQGRRMAALGQYAGLGQQDVANRMAGAGLLDQGTARTLQGIGLGGAANQLRYDDPSRLYGVGQQRQQAQWAPGAQFMGLLNSAPGLGGGGVTQQPSATNPFQEVLGGALGLGSLGLMIGGPMGLAPGLFGGAAASGGAAKMLANPFVSGARFF